MGRENMNPVYLAYLDTHPTGDGVAQTANGEPLYKFIFWAQDMASEYLKELNQPYITDHKHYLNWLNEKIKTSGKETRTQAA